MDSKQSSRMDAAGVNANGQRLIRRGSNFQWLHPGDMLAGDEDCTLMDDAEFEACVLRALGVAASNGQRANPR